MDHDITGLIDSVEINRISTSIFNFRELGTQEFKSSELLVHSLRDHGFRMEFPYMGMKTAFRAELGNGHPSIGLLAEYDALPNGHSCGHNVIASWAYGTAITLAGIMKTGRIVVYGTPSEEGIGEYAGSKALLSDRGAFSDVDAVFGCHPDVRWAVGTTALSDITLQFTFLGRASHAADSPEKGINALDAAVMAYQGINNIRSWIGLGRHPVIGMIFREAGTAINVVPDRAVLEVDLRSTSGKFLGELVEKVKGVARGSAEAIGAELEVKELTPLYQDYLNNDVLNGLLGSELKNMKILPHVTDRNEIPSGSTDEANVSRVVPTGHLDIRISEEVIPGHSDAFREAADPKNSTDNTLAGIAAAAGACLRILEDPNIVKKAWEEFKSCRRE